MISSDDRRSGDGDQLRRWGRDADDRAVFLFKLREVELEEVVQPRGRPGGEILAGVGGHPAVVFLLGMRMHAEGAVEATDVSAELRADVEEFVEDRHHL